MNQALINNLSKFSVKFEIQADEYMINKISQKKINTSGLIKFLNNLPNQEKNYFISHPKSKDRINMLLHYSSSNKKNSSHMFEWLKAKYTQKSNVEEFNNFYINLEKGIYVSDNNLKNINKIYIEYELYKKGLISQNLDIFFYNLLKVNTNTFLKIEFYNHIIDKNIKDKFYVIEKDKHNSNLQKEYFYYYLYGKFYNKVDNINLSNYYFCQFYILTNIQDKSNYFCSKYNIDKVSQIDKTYGILK